MPSRASQEKEKLIRRPRRVEADYQAALLVEYTATQDKIDHADQITWQRATVLIAAVVTSLAVVVAKVVDVSYPTLIAVSAWFTGIIIMWYLWDRRLQTEGTLKFKRLHEIEKMLGLRQHLMIDEADRRNERKGPTGRTLAKWLMFWLIAGWWALAVGKLVLQLLR